MSLLESPAPWASESLENLLVHVIGGDWGVSTEHEEQGYEKVACIRGSEFRDWARDNGRTAVLRKVKANSLEKRSLLPGDILLEISGGGPDQPVGRTVLITQAALSQFDTPVVGTNFLRLLRPSEVLDQRFLNRYLEFFYSSGEVVRYQGGSNNLRNLKFKEYSQILVPVAPLAEQKVIAEKLNTLLAQVETTKARLERIPQILKRFRQSVLAAAVSGRLTEEWRSSSGSYVHEHTDGWKWNPIPETWEVKLYPELVESRLGKMLDKAKNSGIPTKYLGNINVRWFNFKLSDVQEILVSETERDELAIQPGDVLICEGGEPGRCAIWDGRINEQIIFQKALHRARVSDALIPEWLVLNLKHDADSLTLEQLFTGTTIKHLTGKALKKYPLRVPPKDEQTEIVRRVDQLFAHADRIEEQVNNALARVNHLTQSILAKALRGELTEQWRKDNPDLISGENSAEALLERIKAERANQKPTKGAKRAKRSAKA